MRPFGHRPDPYKPRLARKAPLKKKPAAKTYPTYRGEVSPGLVGSPGAGMFGNIFDTANAARIAAARAAQAKFKKNAASDRAANAKQGNPKPVMSLGSVFETVGLLGSTAKKSVPRK
jgi:hypothetical protein